MGLIASLTKLLDNGLDNWRAIKRLTGFLIVHEHAKKTGHDAGIMLELN